MYICRETLRRAVVEKFRTNMPGMKKVRPFAYRLNKNGRAIEPLQRSRRPSSTRSEPCSSRGSSAWTSTPTQRTNVGCRAILRIQPTVSSDRMGRNVCACSRSEKVSMAAVFSFRWGRALWKSPQSRCCDQGLDIASITSISCDESCLPPPRPIRALNICVTRAVPGSAMPRVWPSSSTIWMSL